MSEELRDILVKVVHEEYVDQAEQAILALMDKRFEECLGEKEEENGIHEMPKRNHEGDVIGVRQFPHLTKGKSLGFLRKEDIIHDKATEDDVALTIYKILSGASTEVAIENWTAKHIQSESKVNASKIAKKLCEQFEVYE